MERINLPPGEDPWLEVFDGAAWTQDPASHISPTDERATNISHLGFDPDSSVNDVLPRLFN